MIKILKKKKREIQILKKFQKFILVFILMNGLEMDMLEDLILIPKF